MSARLLRAESVSVPDHINRGNNSLSAGSSLQIPIPVIDQNLLTYLNHTFPDRLSLVDQLGLERAKGARAVVDHLSHLFKEQQ